MSLLATATTRVLLGTWVYVIPLRHPLVTARLFQTADLISGGRVRVGVGVGYIPQEFEATGIDFRTRGSRTDEAIRACRELWSGPDAQFHGRFFDFEHLTMVANKEAAPHLPVLVGGESDAAFRRAARLGDGWIGGEFTPSTLMPVLSRLRSVEAEQGRETPLELTIGAGRVTGRPDLQVADAEMIEEFESLGVDRVIVRPWNRSSEALDGLKAFAKRSVR
jgi:probable F420-dependent oxidoreductase